MVVHFVFPEILKFFMQLLKRVQGVLSAEALLLRHSFPMVENEAAWNNEKRPFNLEIRSIKVTCTIIFNMFFLMPSSHKISFNIIQNKWNGHIRGALSNGSYQISPLCISKSHVLYQILDSNSKFIINDINTSVLKRDIYTHLCTKIVECMMLSRFTLRNTTYNWYITIYLNAKYSTLKLKQHAMVVVVILIEIFYFGRWSWILNQIF